MRFLTKRGHRPLKIVPILVQKMVHQDCYILTALSQRRKPQTHTTNPVVQIFAKIPCPYFRFQIARASAYQTSMA